MKENRVEDLADSRFCKWAQIALVLIWIPILRVLSIWLPFGEEVFAGVGLRTTTQKYSVTDKARQRFALTERDEATGLDHTLFRKNDSFAGRWTSPDALSGSIADPQSSFTILMRQMIR